MREEKGKKKISFTKLRDKMEEEEEVEEEEEEGERRRKGMPAQLYLELKWLNPVVGDDSDA